MMQKLLWKQKESNGIQHDSKVNDRVNNAHTPVVSNFGYVKIIFNFKSVMCSDTKSLGHMYLSNYLDRIS